MRFVAASLTGLLLLASCAAQQAGIPATTRPAPNAADLRITAEAGDMRIISEAGDLQALLAQTVPQHGVCTPRDAQSWIKPAQMAVADAGLSIERAQVLVVVDRNPQRQELCLVLARKDASWQVIGGSKVSTGQSGRYGYFITPTGVFLHTDGIVDYRAEGTFNENHIRGLGGKGMRVWDFGWQQASKGWTSDDPVGEIRLLLHATDPDYLEQRLGRRASKGCVRIPAAMNRFLDHNGVLDADYNATARTDPRIAAVLPPDQQPTLLAGDALVIIDSSAMR